MNYERCPNCNGKLAIPDKKRGQPVECPVCELEFVPAKNARAQKASSDRTVGKKLDQSESSTSKKNKPSLRALPVPTSVVPPREATNENSHFDPSVPDPLLPPGKSRLDILAPSSKQKAQSLSGPPSPPPTRRPASSESHSASFPVPQTDALPIPADKPAGEQQVSPARVANEATETDGRKSVARIITTEPAQSLLTKDGKLPTLQLNDDIKPKKKESSLSSNPLFVGLLICASLVSSGLMLIMFGLPPSENQKTVAKARESIRQFYEVREDEELKPFQLELREAELAHSRGDHDAEIKAYQDVMARFRAEDRNQYTGLTGSPTWDRELEDLVSILLKEAKREKKSFLD
jgi:hypothetical protein